MKKILGSSSGLVFSKRDCDYHTAKQLCEEHQSPFKEEYVKILKNRGVESFSFYTHGDFIDLCEGLMCWNSTSSLKMVLSFIGCQGLTGWVMKTVLCSLGSMPTVLRLRLNRISI